MTPADRNAGHAVATLDDVAAVQRIGIEEGRLVVAILQLSDGRRASWRFVLGAPVGQDQQLRVLPSG